MDAKKRFGLSVKQRRNQLGISQEELAMRISADQAYISRVETGQINLTLDTADQIASALQSDISMLFGPVETGKQ